MKKICRLASLVFVITLLFATQAAFANFPTGPITMIAHFGEGGTVDVNGRIMAAAMTERLGQRVNVVNITGGSGEIGAMELLNSPKDGYTIGVLGFVDTLIIGEMRNTVGLDDFEAICQVSAVPFAMYAKPGSQFASMSELVEFARNNPRRVTVAESGNSIKLWIAAWMQEAGIEVTTVNFQSGAESMNALFGGHVELAITNPAWIPNVLENGGTVIAIGGDTLENYPDVATMSRLGYGTVDALGTTTTIVLPKGLPDEIRQVYLDVVADIGRNEAVLRQIKDAGFLGDYVYGEEYIKQYEQHRDIVLNALRDNIDMLQ